MRRRRRTRTTNTDKCTTSKNGEKFFEFSSVTEFAVYTDKHKLEGSNGANEKNSSGYCNISYKDALKQARKGNPELVKEMFEGFNLASEILSEGRTDYIRDVEGEFFDVGDFLSGEPEYAFRQVQVEQKPVVKVLVNFGVNCRWSDTELINRGRAIVALCDCLQQTGHIVELNIGLNCERSDGDGYGNIHFKMNMEANPIDLDALAFVIANPGCLRRLYFVLYEYAIQKNISYGYGKPQKLDTNGYDLAFNSQQHGDYSTLNDAKQVVVRMIEKYTKARENGDLNAILDNETYI